MKHPFVFFIFFFTALVGCGPLTGTSTGANLIEGMGELIGGKSTLSIGNSSYLFKDVASNGGSSGHLYRIEFELPEKERLSFVLHGNSFLGNGGTFIFERLNGEVTLLLKLNGKEHKIDLPSFSNSQIVDIDIDFHNDHSDTHIIMWKTSGSFSDQEGCSFSGECLYNTEDFALDVWLGVGKASGSIWGFQGRRELIKKALGPLAVRSNL